MTRETKINLIGLLVGVVLGLGGLFVTVAPERVRDRWWDSLTGQPASEQAKPPEIAAVPPDQLQAPSATVPSPRLQNPPSNETGGATASGSAQGNAQQETPQHPPSNETGGATASGSAQGNAQQETPQPDAATKPAEQSSKPDEERAPERSQATPKQNSSADTLTPRQDQSNLRIEPIDRSFGVDLNIGPVESWVPGLTIWVSRVETKGDSTLVTVGINSITSWSTDHQYSPLFPRPGNPNLRQSTAVYLVDQRAIRYDYLGPEGNGIDVNPLKAGFKYVFTVPFQALGPNVTKVTMYHWLFPQLPVLWEQPH